MERIFHEQGFLRPLGKPGSLLVENFRSARRADQRRTRKSLCQTGTDRTDSKSVFCPSALYDRSTSEDANNAIVRTEYIYPFVFSEQNGGTMRLLEPVYQDVSVFPHRKCPPSAAAIGADGEAANHRNGLAANSANCLRNEGNQMQHGYLFPRHLGRSNLVFADGHVESWKGKTFPARQILRWSGVRDSEGKPKYDNAVIVNVTTWFDANRNFFVNGNLQGEG